MYASPTTPDEILVQALAVVRDGDETLYTALDELPAALYVTDAHGLVTYFNPACIDFTGRTPALHEDHWCVTWKLYSLDGQFLPHDQCPMAVAIRDREPIRGVTAIAERPDGTRVRFMPYPTPFFDRSGELLGAINLLINLGDEQADYLRTQAQKARRLAMSMGDRETARILNLMASEYEAKASAS